jgi:predicted transposase/invertase (TIGR01784 family)
MEMIYLSEKILSPKSDLIFKLIFGDEKNKDILKAFLIAVLDLPPEEFVDLTLVNTHLQLDMFEGKLGILDVKVHTSNGKIIDVEIQVHNIPQIRERIMFYSAKMITEQIDKGEEYNKIKRVITILITDYVLIKENNAYHNRYTLYDCNTGSQFTDLIEVDTLELPKIPLIDDNTSLITWLKFIKSETEEELAVLEQVSPEMKKAVEIVRLISSDEDIRALDEAREKARRDWYSQMDGARQEGMEKGIQKGIQKGMQQGMQQGIQEGLATVAKTMISKKKSVEEIVELTGLSINDIHNLIANQ